MLHKYFSTLLTNTLSIAFILQTVKVLRRLSTFWLAYIIHSGVIDRFLEQIADVEAHQLSSSPSRDWHFLQPTSFLCHPSLVDVVVSDGVIFSPSSPWTLFTDELAVLSFSLSTYVGPVSSATLPPTSAGRTPIALHIWVPEWHHLSSGWYQSHLTHLLLEDIIPLRSS